MMAGGYSKPTHQVYIYSLPLLSQLTGRIDCQHATSRDQSGEYNQASTLRK